MEKKKKNKKVDSEKEYLFDISQHSLVPKHEILSEEEAKELLETYNITKPQLPKMKAKDPMAKRLNAKVGDVIRIKRKSHTLGEGLYYREVVE